MRSTSLAAALLTGLFAVSAALESFAQFGGGTPGGSARGSRSRPDGEQREQRPPVQDNSPEQIEDRLGMLEEDLQLRADQRAAWQACEEKIIAYAADIGREQTRRLPGDATLSSIQQIDHTVDIARNRLTALEDIASAAKTLYGTLTVQQKSVIDPRLANIVSSISNPARGGGPPRPKRPL